MFDIAIFGCLQSNLLNGVIALASRDPGNNFLVWPVISLLSEILCYEIASHGKADADEFGPRIPPGQILDEPGIVVGVAVAEDPGRGDVDIFEDADMIENGHSIALELGLIDHATNINRFGRIANARAQSQRVVAC